MEIRTTVRNFPEQARRLHIPPETMIRVLVDDGKGEPTAPLPKIDPAEQRRLLNLLPNEYRQGASDELIEIIEESHVNTDDINL